MGPCIVITLHVMCGLHVTHKAILVRLAASCCSLAKLIVVAIAATVPMTGKWIGQSLWSSNLPGPGSTGTSSSLAGYAEKVSQLVTSAADKFVAPPSIRSPHEPLLQNPHQTYNGVARMLKDQAHHVQLAAADTHLGDDVPAQRLKQQLQDWWQQMHRLSASYQKMQGSFSKMLHSQERVLHEVQNLANTFLSNVEMMLQLDSCNSKEPDQESICQQHTVALLQDCRNATIRARAKISKHECMAQQVHQLQNDLSAGLENAASAMQHVSHTAQWQQELAAVEVQAAEEHASRARRDADTKAGAVIPAGVATLFLCVAVPPACILGIMGTGQALVESGNALSRLDDAQSALARSAQLRRALHNYHATALDADRVTAEIMEVVNAQSSWVHNILSGLGDLEAVMGNVIDITLNISLHERRVVLKHLHRELTLLLQAITRLLNLSSKDLLVG